MRVNGPIKVYNPGDTVPLDAEGGYAGGDSTAAAVATAGAQALAAQQTIQNLQGAATTLPAGSAATVTVTGSGTTKVINVGIPKGADGANGAPGKDGMGYTQGLALLADSAAAKNSAAQSATSAAQSVTLTQQAQAASLEVPDANVSALMGNPATDTRAALNDAVEVEAGIVKPAPATGVPVTVTDALTNSPYWMGRDRRTLYRGGGSTLKISTDDGGTWTQATAQLFNPYIAGVRDLDNGEVLVSTAASGGTPGSLWRSTGGVGGTWTKVLDAGRDVGGTLVGPSSHFSGNWGMDAHDNIAVVSEYGLQRPDLGDQARFVWLSQDYGATWARIYDIGTAAQAHVHAVFYDPWWKAIWVSQGDQTNRAVKVSFDMGATWTTVANPDNVQLVGGLALPGCVLFSTDYQPDGIYRVARTQDRTGLTIEVAYKMAGGLRDRRRFIGGMPFWTGRSTDPAIFPFISDETWAASGRLIATMDGHTFTQVWADSRTYTHKGLWKAMGPTVSGVYVGELEDDRGPIRSMLRLAYIPPLRATPPVVDLIDVAAGAGSYTNGDVVTFGRFAFAPPGVGTSLVQGGSATYENVVGGNLANVNTATSNLAGAPALTGQNGNWVFILSGYDNVANGWALVINGFHNKVAADANHVTIAGGSLHDVAAGVAYSTIGGGTGNDLTGNVATIAGGQDNTAGVNATVAGGLRNTGLGNSSTIGGGLDNVAQQQSSTVGGGFGHLASGNSSTVSGGQANVASGQGSTVPGGRENVAAANYSVATGRQARTAQNGEHAHAGGAFTVSGDAQVSVIPVKRQTTDATPSDLQCEGGLPPMIPEHTTWAFHAIVAARRADADAANAAWEVVGLFKRDAGNTAALVGTPTVTQIGATTGSTWTLAVSSYSAGHLRLVATGETGKTIRWVARLELAQVNG